MGHKQLRNFNFTLFLPIFIFYLLSVAVQYGAAQIEGQAVTAIVLRQIVFCVVSIICLVSISFLRTSLILKYSPFFYWSSLGLMSLLYWFHDPVMYELTRTKRWMRIGEFTFQPSELVKLTFVLFMVYQTLIYEEKYPERTIGSDLGYLLRIALYSLPTFLLMSMQRDLGTTLVFIAILGALFIISGVHWKILTLITSVAAVVGLSLLLLVFTDWGNQILYALNFQTYQLDRIRAWRDPFAYADSIAYQQVQSLFSIAVGGFFGRSAELEPVYVPVRESDMVFTVIGESFGFVGSTVVIFLYFYLFYQIITVAYNTNNKANLYIAVSFVFGLVFQIFENIGATIGLLPLTGIPLPFLSQGGTALIVLGMSLGVLMGFREEEEGI